MKGERKKERREKRGGKNKKKGGGESSTAGLEPVTFHSTANCLQLLPEVELHTQTY